MKKHEKKDALLPLDLYFSLAARSVFRFSSGHFLTFMTADGYRWIFKILVTVYRPYIGKYQSISIIELSTVFRPRIFIS